MMSYLKQWIIKCLSLGVYTGIDRKAYFLSDLSKSYYEEYLSEGKRIADGKVLKNEITHLVNAAGKRIIRTTSNPIEIAFHRGGIVYLGQLQRRITELEARYKEMRKKKR